ncbi:tetratricopeptide repeat protein [Desulfothermus okinawensis JCM 13304]
MERRKKLVIFILVVFLAGCGLKRHTFNYKPTPIDIDALSTYYYLRFLDFAKQKKYKEAQQSLKKALNYKADPEFYIEYARLLISQKKIKEAEDILKAGLQKNPGNKELVFFLSDIYMYQKEHYNAYSLLKIYIKEHPNDYIAREKIADILFQEKKFNTAIKYLLEIPQEKRSYKTHFILGKCYLKINDRKKAIYHFKKATKLNPNFLRGWVELAYLYELENDLVSAEKIYSKLISQGFTNKELLLRLIEIDINLGNIHKAFSIAQDYISDPKDLIDAIGLFLKENLYDQAEELLKTIENFKDEYPRISYYYALIKLKKYKDAESALKSIDEIPTDSDIYLNALDLKIKILINEKKYNAAEKILEEQVKKHPNNKKLRIFLSDLYVLNKKYNEAKRIIEESLKQNPDDLNLLFQLGTIYYKLNNIESSLSIMEKILKIDPNHASALNFIGYTLVEKGTDLKRGYELIKKALLLEPNNGYFLDSMAWYYYKIKDYRKAWEYIKKAVQNTKMDPTIWEHYGDIALKLKNFKEAKKGYKNSLLNEPEDPLKIKKKLNALK